MMRRLCIWTGFLFFLVLFGNSHAFAVTDILEGAEVQADPETVKAILTTFNRAEDALRAESLSGVMAVYSKDYRNRGLRKEDTSRIWEDIFSRYDHLSSRHVFSRIVADQEKKTAQVTCTGALFGVSILRRDRKMPSPAAFTAEPVQIDIWFDAIHYLVFEGDEWKIIGHDPGGERYDSFGSGIHLLF
ncbi:MAG: hypothetical protein HZA13_09975 [Nitrospirae bacterium]|nr:hypothetical protein [Nitrospirota bacterium]